MIYQTPRMLSLVLAFGIFFTLSCSTVRDTGTSKSSNNEETSLQEQINNLNQQISEEPGNTDLQTEKAHLLYQYSQNISDPGNRNPVYMNIRDIADSYSADASTSEQLDEVLSQAWHSEQQSGMRLLQKMNQIKRRIIQRV